MSKKLLFLISFVLVLILANSVFAQPETDRVAYWSGFSDGSSWDDANNWWTVDELWDEVNYPTVPGRIWAKAPNAVPDADTFVMVGQGTPWYEYPAVFASTPAVGYPVIDGQTAVCYQIYISTGPNDTNRPGRLDMSSGTLTSRVYGDDWLGMQIGNVPQGSGVVNLSGGDILLDNYDGEGGLLTVGGNNYWDVAAGGGVGTLNMTGGTLTCYHMDCPDSDAIQDVNLRPIGYINLHGGIFYTSADEDWTEFWLGDVDQFPDSRIDVTDGIAIITSHDENELWWINLWIEQGKITAFGGVAPRAELYKDYDTTNPGKTTLQAIATELGQAWQPRPLPGASVNYRPTLTWTPGDYAVTHKVYFSSDRDAVVNGTAPNTPTGDVNNYYAGILDWTTPYFWRVDEANDPCLWEGVVWDFKTDDHLAVEDMDSYGPDPAMRNVWKDVSTGTLDKNGAEIFVEVDPAFVRARQSMRYAYMNYEYNRIGATLYYVGSEAEASTADLEIGSDWVSSGPEALVLYFYGDAGNGTDQTSPITMNQMYVAVEDGSAQVGIVKYDTEHNYDMNAVTEASWQEWNIDLQDPCLADVNLANIAKVYIGFGGQKTGQMEPGAGDISLKYDTVWFDDIGLYPPRCVPDVCKPATDVTADCITDYQELEKVAADWLKSGYDISAVPPLTDPNRLVRYTFDTEGGSGTTVYNTDTTLGSAADGTIFDLYSAGPGGPLTWETPGAAHPDVCEPNYCIQLSGYDEQAVIMDSNLNDIVGGGFTTNHLTITCWVKRDGDQLEWTGLVFSSSELPSDDPVPHAGLSLGANDDWTAGGTTPAQNHLAYHWEDCADENDATPDGEDQIWWWRSGLLVPDGQWTFCAVTVEPEQATVYMIVPGEDMLKAVNTETHVPTTFEDPFNIGRDPRILWGSRTLYGQIDDVQIYDYALSDVELLYVAQESGSSHVGLVSLVDFDVSDDIDFLDYAAMANDWLVGPILWPIR